MTDQSVADSIQYLVRNNDQVTTYTWVNHFSCLQNMTSNIDISDFNFVGIDGELLAKIMRFKGKTTAADRVLPLVLTEPLRVVLIGGTQKQVAKRIEVMNRKFPNAKIVGNYDGYSFNLLSTDFGQSLFSDKPDLIVVGIGSPAQDALAIFLKRCSVESGLNGHAVILTCGGWLDQILFDSYYPRWSYKLKSNWIIRLIREPARLWKRYTIYATVALLNKGKIRSYLADVIS
jgi:exopolysaccharide biosynthesis WecB/TagA/CpsF family protein